MIAWCLTLGLGWFVTRPLAASHAAELGAGRRFGHQFDRLGRMLEAATVLLRPHLFLFGLALGMLAWGLEGTALSLITREVGGVDRLRRWNRYLRHRGIGRCAVVPAGGLGSTEAVMGMLLITFGADSAAAVAITLLCRIATLWFAVVLGGLAVAVLSLRGQGPASECKP